MTFDKNFTTYDNNAIVQKKVAANLSEYIKNDISLSGNMNKIIELGCGTGIFTKNSFLTLLPNTSLLMIF